MLEFKDFVPRMLKPAGLLGEPDFESFKDALASCNAWVEANGVEAVNVAMVLLPRLHHPFEGVRRT